MTHRRHSLQLLLALLTFAGLATPALAGSMIDVKHLALDLRFDWTARQTQGTATLTLVPTVPSRSVALAGAKLEIDSINLVDGTPLTFEYDGSERDDALTIDLQRERRAGEELKIEIAYRTNWINDSDPNNIWGSEGKGLRFFAPTATEPVKRRQIWSHNFPTASRYWFPGHDDPADLRTTEMRLTVTQPLQAIANGDLISTTVNDDGTRTFHWRLDRPHANHQTSLVVGTYHDIKSEWDGIPLHSFGYPDEVEAVAATVVRLPDMVRFFSEQTGLRYPFTDYKQVFVQDYPWGAGNATGSILTENMIDDFRIHEDYRWLWDDLQAEGVAHQWFGAAISARDLSHAWLTRGFARYFAALYNEAKNGRSELLLWQRPGDLGTVMADWSSGIKEPLILPEALAREKANGNGPYFRGAVVLHMLRAEIGDAAFWDAIRRYVARHAGGTVTTADFRRAVEEAAGRDLGFFFEQWLEKVGHPIFQVTKSFDATKKELRLTVKQTQTPDPAVKFPQVEFFRGSVDVKVDDEVRRVELAPQAENIFVFPAERTPSLVHFDVEGAWLKEMTFEKSLDELLYQLKHDEDVVAQAWAIAELVKIAKAEAAPAADKAKIHAGLRAAILRDDFWRIKLTATNQLQGLLAPWSSSGPVDLDVATRETLVAAINRQKAWNRAAAIGFLGMTRDPRYAELYLEAMHEPSHPVIYAAAIALGKTKSPKAFDALARLTTIPSWKGENILSGLAGLKELGDPRAAEIALAAFKDQYRNRWTLATPRWDYRLAGAQTLVALGRADLAVPIVLERFEKSLLDNDLNDIIANAQLAATLADPRGRQVFARLRERFKENTEALKAVEQFATQLEDALALAGS